MRHALPGLYPTCAIVTSCCITKTSGDGRSEIGHIREAEFGHKRQNSDTYIFSCSQLVSARKITFLYQKDDKTMLTTTFLNF